MLITFRKDASAQVTIHTANMIPRDWGNMTQAVWQSPLLPIQTGSETTAKGAPGSAATAINPHPIIGSGERFKVDLMRYLNAYGKRLDGLTQQLAKHDFSKIRAAFIASAPSKQKPNDSRPAVHTSFGWLGLKEVLSRILTSRTTSQYGGIPNIVIQVSSIATLGQNSTWLENFQSALSSSLPSDRQEDLVPSSSSKAPPSSFIKASQLSHRTAKQASTTTAVKPTFNIIFPTADEIRTSLDGYESGGSIHTKIQSPAQQKQLENLRPLLCHWRSDLAPNGGLPQKEPERRREAHRGPAAPHIKTYIRFSDAQRRGIDWAMVTSANLSKQAWGDVVSKRGDVWIQSYECGVVVWPALFGRSGGDKVGGLEGEGEASGAEEVSMVPVFGRDMPGPEDSEGAHNSSSSSSEKDVCEVDDGSTTEDEGESTTEDEIEDETEDDEEERPKNKDEDEDETEDEQEQEEQRHPSRNEDEIETEDEDEEEVVTNSFKPNSLLSKDPKTATTTIKHGIINTNHEAKTHHEKTTTPSSSSSMEKQFKSNNKNIPKTVVGLRMPYDLPLAAYAAQQVPWCASMAHEEPDWAGRTWSGY